MVTVVSEAPNSNPGMYDEIVRRLGITDTNLPEGLVVHSASQTENGMLIVDVWQTEEQFRTFSQRLRSAVHEVAGQVEDIPPKIYRTHDLKGPWVPAAMRVATLR